MTRRGTSLSVCLSVTGHSRIELFTHDEEIHLIDGSVTVSVTGALLSFLFCGLGVRVRIIPTLNPVVGLQILTINLTINCYKLLTIKISANDLSPTGCG